MFVIFIEKLYFNTIEVSGLSCEAGLANVDLDRHGILKVRFLLVHLLRFLVCRVPFRATYYVEWRQTFRNLQLGPEGL
jgi:hypothetical protein